MKTKYFYTGDSTLNDVRKDLEGKGKVVMFKYNMVMDLLFVEVDDGI